MNQQNFSPIKSKHGPTLFGNKEAEPKFREPIPIPDGRESEQEPITEIKTTEKTARIEIIPELPEIDNELREEGVELVDHDTIFVNNRKIDLPLPLEEIDEGLQKPVSSGWRWLSELTKYILARFHIVIKKVGRKFKLVEQN